MYKLLQENFDGVDSSVMRVFDCATIPPDHNNTDYQEYLRWLEEGNTPEPADVPPEPIVDPKMVGIEFDGAMCSATSTDQSGLMAILLAVQLQGAKFQPTRFAFENGSSLVLHLGNFQQFVAVWMPFRQGFFKP